MSEEAVKSGELYNGSDRGRIYRISRTDAKPATWTKDLQLGDATDEALVEELSSPNSWWRINAQRLLVDRANVAIATTLGEHATHAVSPYGRLHSLWTLEGLRKLTPALIEQALKDPEAGIRENAIRLAELHFTEAPELKEALLPLQADSDARVRYQLLCTLGFLETPAAAEARRNILFRDIDDNWIQIAALSVSSSQTHSILKDVLENFQPDRPAYPSLVLRLAEMVGASGKTENIRQLIQQAAKGNNGWQAPVLEGLAQGLKRTTLKSRPFNHELSVLVALCFEHPSASLRNASLQLLTVLGIEDKSVIKKAIDKAVGIAADENISDEKRVEAIKFLSLDDLATHVELLKSLIVPQEQPSVQREALKVLALLPDLTVTNYVLEKWPALTPEMREAAINTFMSSPDRVEALLNAIDSGRIQKSSLAFYQSGRLMTQPDEKLRSRARIMFAQNSDAAINKEYQGALHLKGEAISGKTIYQQNCAICHQVRGGIGVSFGPDLGTVHNWQPEGIMANILAPDLSIAAGYELRELELNNGETVQGIVSNETPGAITLKNTGTMERTINRQDIRSLKTLDISVMPAGWEKKISHQQMADLLAFLRQNN